MKIELINDQPEFSGTGVYAWNLFRALDGLAEVRMSYYDSKGGLCRVIGPGAEEFSMPARMPALKPFFWWDCHRRLPHRDLSHFVSQNLSFLRTEGKRIVTCLDLIPLIVPKNPAERIWRRLLYSGVKRADRVIAISEHTKKDLMRIYRIPGERITVTHLGVSPEFHPRDRKVCRRDLGLPPEGRMVLHVGTAARRKNFTAVCLAFAAVRRETGDALLVKVGGIPEDGRRLIASLGLGNSFMLRDRVPAGQLPLYYSAADVFLFPSTYEGFGLPALEAMASGCPVVASNAASLPEVVGEAGIMHQPGDHRGMADTVLRILSDGGESLRLREAGLARAALFTWERTARETAAVYRLALLGKP